MISVYLENRDGDKQIFGVASMDGWMDGVSESFR